MNDTSRSANQAKGWIPALRWILLPCYVAVLLICLRHAMFDAPHEDYARAMLKVLPGMF